MDRVAESAHVPVERAVWLLKAVILVVHQLEPVSH
jgi:hypothetical protein